MGEMDIDESLEEMGVEEKDRKFIISKMTKMVEKKSRKQEALDETKSTEDTDSSKSESDEPNPVSKKKKQKQKRTKSKIGPNPQSSESDDPNPGEKIKRKRKKKKSKSKSKQMVNSVESTTDESDDLNVPNPEN